MVKLANAKGLKHGTVQDKLFLPGLKKLAFLRDSGFFGRILSVRGEFGYWVFEGGWQEAQRPSWNYRSEDGGGIILDMVCHWRYVLDNLFGEVESVTCLGTTDIPERFDEKGKQYKATADDSAYATFRLKGGVIAHINMSWVTRVYRDDLVTFQVDGTLGSAVAGLSDCVIQAAAGNAAAGMESGREALHDFYGDWQKLPENVVYDNGFKEQWEMFIRHVCEDAPYKYTLLEGAKGVQLAECALQSWKERRWIDVARSRCEAGPEHEQACFACFFAVTEFADTPTALETYRLAASRTFPAKLEGTLNRVAFSAAHVVADPRADVDPWLTSAIDWDRTIAFREHIWDLGLGVAEAMDTAQRGMGLDWTTSLELIRRSVQRGKGQGPRAGVFRCRHRSPRGGGCQTIDDVIRAYEEQIAAVERSGGGSS